MKQIRQNITAEHTLPGGRELHLTYATSSTPPVPAILIVPDRPQPAPAAVLLHGYSSRKEHMAGPVGRTLLEHGIASIAIDLPLHGTRHDPVQAQSARQPLQVVKLWRLALAEARLAMAYLAARPEIDSSRLGVVGYSMGAFLAVMTMAEEPRLRACVLAAGGDLPRNTPFAFAARRLADPLRAVRKFGGRPLLMINGRHDRTITPDQAERLFAAAAEPKELRWIDAAHRLPPDAARYAARWLRTRLDEAATARSA